MIILGGYTRLSQSGLSIVEWAPIKGTILPLSQQSWNIEFNKYQQSPEYQKINYGMSLEEFKQIFVVEYSHRLLGRLIGLAFLLPFLYFLFKRNFSKTDIYYYSFILILIASQGGIGWIMVKSGLIDNPHVSQYRLTLHLIMACFIMILITWKIVPGINKDNQHGYVSLILVLLQIASGGFVAGLKAGLVYNTFPLMDGKIIPDGLFLIQPWYKNIFENIVMVQFIHRILATINLINLLAYSYKLFNLDHAKKIAILLAVTITIQFSLGIITLILQVPMFWALLHQAVAIILLLIIVASLKIRDSNAKNL
jgi:cytochrome c oxidase assembly protein subunit 15